MDALKPIKPDPESVKREQERPREDEVEALDSDGNPVERKRYVATKYPVKP